MRARYPSVHALQRRLLVLVVVAFGTLVMPGVASGASTTASFTYPTNGAQNVDTAKAFSWTSVAGVQTYYLYVGTSQGAKDLVDTGGISSTSYSVPPLPTGQTLWARIWTKANDVWTYQD